MQKTSWIVAGIAAALLATAQPGHTQEGTAPDWANKNGAVGLGFNTTMGGTDGLVLRTYVSPLFGIQATLGLQIISANIDPSTDVDGDDYSASQRKVDFGLHGTYKLAYWQRGSLSTLFGADIRNINQSVDDQDGVGGTNILLALGLQAEWFPTQYLSVYMSGGLRVDILGNDDFDRMGGGGFGSDYSGINIGINGDLLGAAGLVVWFK